MVLYVLRVDGVRAGMQPFLVVQIGAAMIAAGAVYVAYKLHTLAGAGEPDMAQSVVTFHRAELVRQRDALKSVWRWYLAPFIPGVLVFVGGTQFSSDINMPLVARLLGLGTSLGIFAVIFGGIFWLNQRAAKKLAKSVEGELGDLAMAGARFVVDLEKVDLSGAPRGLETGPGGRERADEPAHDQGGVDAHVVVDAQLRGREEGGRRPGT